MQRFNNGFAFHQLRFHLPVDIQLGFEIVIAVVVFLIHVRNIFEVVGQTLAALDRGIFFVVAVAVVVIVVHDR